MSEGMSPGDFEEFLEESGETDTPDEEGAAETEPESVANPYRIGDPVMDAAQGRPMIVIDAPDETVATWSESNDYDLTANYANEKFGASTGEPVVECIYVSDVRSEPSKTYTFPASRLRLIDVHHADDGRRLYDRVARDLLEAVFAAAMQADDVALDTVVRLSRRAGVVDPSAIDEARELADIAMGLDGGDDDVR